MNSFLCQKICQKKDYYVNLAYCKNVFVWAFAYNQ